MIRDRPDAARPEGWAGGAAPEPGVGPAGSSAPAGATRAAYRDYRRQQALRLLALVPREAVRDLYGRAREWAHDRGIHRAEDPLATIGAYCEELLPLPPFRTWLADVVANPDAHAHVLGSAASADDSASVDEAPVTVDVRPLRHGGRRWYASLNLRRMDDAWRGFIAFRRDREAPAYRTAEIFREESAEAVRRRFDDFDESSLQAFLRSVLP